MSIRDCISAALRVFSLVAVVVATSQSGLAQTVLEEIIVTAERREASLQETAISISAFTSEDLVRNGIETSEQLTGFTPGLQIQRDVIGKVVIRGIGTENFTIAGDPGVAIFSDGAYLARSSVAIFDMYDLERVEVLRGPQGTLYGRNATGGAINFISKKPTEDFEATVSADVGDYSKVRLEGAVSGTLVEDTLTGRLSGLYHNRDGYTDNIFPDVGRGLDELDDKDLWSLRGQLSWQASDSVTVDLRGDVYNDDSNPVPYKYVDDPLIYFGAMGMPGTGIPFPNPLANDLRTVSQGYEFDVPGTNITIGSAGTWDQWGLLGTVNWELANGMTLKSITSYRDIEFEWLNDGDGIEAYLVNYFQIDDSEQFTQEFQLISDDEGPLTWTAGVYFLDEDADSFMGIPVVPLVGIFDPAAVLIEGESETTAYAVFGEATWAFREDLRLNLGLRYSYEEKEVFYVNNRFGFVNVVDDDDDWNSVTPKIGLDWFWTEDVMFYAGITKGFKSGGFNLLAVQPSYDEEEVWSYEIGTKGRYLDGRLQLNASAFYYDYDDLQVGKVVQLNATIENAAAATIYGAEVELRALLTENFEIDWGLSLLDTEYDEFETEDKGQLGAPSVSLEGNELPRAPNVTSSLSALYNWELGGRGNIEIWGNWQYTDDQFFTPFNRANFEQESYSVLNASLTYRTADGRWAVSVYGDNLGDEDYFTNALESGVPTAGVDPLVPQFFVGAPRTWGVRVKFNYGG
jgi:iron complex outermembrane receptor protein